MATTARQSKKHGKDPRDWRFAIPYSPTEWPAVKTEILLRLGQGEKDVSLAKEFGIEPRQVRYIRRKEQYRVERTTAIRNELYEQGWRDELAAKSVRGLMWHADQVEEGEVSYNDAKIFQGNAKGLGHFKVGDTVTNLNQQNNLIISEEAAARLLNLEQSALTPRVIVEATLAATPDPSPEEHSGPDQDGPAVVAAECDENL